MATKAFLLPDLGEGLTEGEIVSWLVAVGDAVEIDQPVAEVETAKAVVEVPSPFGGVVAELHAEVGAEVEVGKPLLTIEVADGEPSTATGEPGTPAAPGEDVRTSSLVPDPAGTVDGGDQGTVTGAPPEDGGSGNVLVGYGTGGRGGSRRRRARGNGPARRGPAAAASGPAASPQPAPRSAGPAAPAGRREPAGGGPQQGRPLAKPPVRKMAREAGIDLATLTGSGPHGSVTRADLEAAIAAAQAPEAPVRAVAPVPGERPAAEQPVGVLVTTPDHEPLGSAPPNLERIPVRGVRRVVSERMTRSRQEIPEATTWVDCDATELLAVRERLNARQDRARVSPLALVLRACVAGLREYPILNARLDSEHAEIVLSRSVHLGFAAQTDRGLVVPVIRDADRRSTLDLAAELNRLAEAARAGKVTPAELSGGTFTVSNYGSFRVDGGSPIINHPEAAILGLGQIAERPWVVDGEVRVRSVVQLSIAFDHRICDGGDAAGFLRFVADCVEDPTFLLASL